MRRLFFVIGIFLLPSAANATFSAPAQAVFNNSCGATSSCAVTVSAIGAGHLLVVLSHQGNTVTLSSVTAAGETFTVIPGSGGAGTNCPFNGGGNSTQVGCAYALKSVGGATTVTCNWSGTAAASNTSCGFYEVAFSAPRVYVEGNAINGSHGSASTFAGADFSNNFAHYINGTNDIIFQMTNVSTGTISSIDSSFVLDNHTGQVADAHILNTFSNTPPTWTNSGAATSIVSALSFGEDYNPNTVGVIPATTPNSGLQLSYSGSVGTRLVTVTAPGQFKLAFDEGDAWGIAQWYDLVNDPGAATNLLGPVYGFLSTNITFAEPGLFQRTYYDFGDSKQFCRSAQYYFPNSPRQLSILEYNSNRIVIETKSEPTVTAQLVLNNMIGTARYYIYPNGQVYVHFVSTVTNAATINPDALFSDMTLEDPTQTGTNPPDTQGWIRASTTQNPYTGVGAAETYLFAYWGSGTPAPYTNYTRASILIVRSPSNTHDAGQILHSWASAPGYGVVRWGWKNSDTINLGAGGTETEDVLIQLGTQGSTVLPNITSSAVAGPIAAAYIASPTPPGPTVVSPPIVNQSATMQFTATDPGTWACAGTNASAGAVACAGSINASTGLYTAPATVTAQQSVGGYELLPNNHIYNVNVSAFPLRGDSATLIAGAGVVNLSINQIAMPINYVDASTPNESEVFYYTTANNGLYQIPAYPGVWPTAAKIEGGWLSARTNNASDHHLLTFSTATGNLQDMYQYYAVGLNGSCLTCSSQSGVKYGYSDYVQPTITTDAAGMYITPLTLRLQEMRQAIATGGTINHALRMTLQNGFLHPAHLWPATTDANAGVGANFYGERVRLKASYNISGYSSTAQIILTAMKNYGVFIADGGTGWAVGAEYTKWPTAIATALFEISSGSIAPSNFEVVDESGFMDTSASGECTCNRERITFTRTSDSTTATADVALQGVAVNFPYDLQQIQVGAPAQTFAAKVNIGAVTYTMSPGGTGTLNASTGLYTPPGSLGSVTTLTITATSTTNAAVAASFTLNVFPAGTIRLIPGSIPGAYSYAMNPTDYTDTSAHLWNSIGDYGGYANDGGAVTGTTDSKLYQYEYASYESGANDMRFDFIVPNGAYRITQKAASTCCSTRLMNLEADGTTVSTNFNLFTLAGGGNKAYDYTTVVTVADNHLSWVQRVVNDVGTSIGSLQIDPITLGSTFTSGNKVTSGVSLK